MDASKRGREGPGPSGPPQKKGSGSGEMEDEVLDEQLEGRPQQALPEDELDIDDVDERLLEEELELHIGEAGRNWERPAPPPLNPAAEALSALACSCDTCI